MIRTALLLILLISTSVTHAADISGKPRIIDGDTIAIAGQRIRLHGIDTPETEQLCEAERIKGSLHMIA